MPSSRTSRAGARIAANQRRGPRKQFEGREKPVDQERAERADRARAALKRLLAEYARDRDRLAPDQRERREREIRRAYEGVGRLT